MGSEHIDLCKASAEILIVVMVIAGVALVGAVHSIKPASVLLTSSSRRLLLIMCFGCTEPDHKMNSGSDRHCHVYRLFGQQAGGFLPNVLWSLTSEVYGPGFRLGFDVLTLAPCWLCTLSSCSMSG